MKRSPTRWLVGASLVLATSASPSAASAHADPVIDSTALRAAITVEGVMAHLQALQQIADDNGGNRASGSPGHVASGDYVVAQLTAAGYDVRTQPFEYDQFVLASEALTQTAPTPTTYEADVDFSTMEYSGAGDVTASVTPVDVVLPPAGGSTSGCEDADFAGFPTGTIALMSRGTCTFREKVDNAAEAGASGAIIFNEGNSPDREGLLFGTLDPPLAAIPAIGTTFALGEIFATTSGLELRLAIDATTRHVETFNVLADSRKGRTSHTVVVGAHLDSVGEGPGINDNGSGSAAILETALQMAELEIKPRNRVRFAFWGGEEDGLIGSEYYVSQLNPGELAQHALNLNFDMVGSPNWVPFVYDGDGSAFGTSGPPGSARVELVFLDYFAARGIPAQPTEFDGRSDYFAFIDNGIPAGGLFTGAEDINPANGEPYDKCYHQACDTIDNVNSDAIDVMSDAIAHATLTFAMTKSVVTGAGRGGSGARLASA